MPDCRAEIRIHDDRWGIFTDRCRLEEGHEGDHRAPRTACEPVAYLGWAEPEHNDGCQGSAKPDQSDGFGCGSAEVSRDSTGSHPETSER